MFKILPVDRLLCGFVSHYWVARVDPSCECTYISTAESFSNIMFFFRSEDFHNIDQQPLFSSSLQGPSISAEKHLIDHSYCIFGATLLPQSIPLFFDFPTADIVNRNTSLETVLGRESVDLAEQIANAKNHDQRAGILNKFLLSKVSFERNRDKNIIDAIQFIQKNNGYVDIASLQSRFSISYKQAERKFKFWTGFTPKVFARIIRFEHAMKTYDGGSLTHLAFENGYFDQAHFTKEVKEFTGYSPRTYLRYSQDMYNA